MLKKLAFLIIAILSFSYLMGLTAGDIAILGVNTDAEKSMIFVALTDIPANTTISFTDNGWNATEQSWRTGEGTISWSHTALVSKGTCITITFTTPPTANLGTVTKSGSFDPAAGGDQILAYEGTTAPTSNTDSIWLYGISIRDWVFANNSNTSDLPTALTNAALAFTGTSTDIDNGYFANGNTAQTEVSVSGTKSQLLALFTDNTKYYTNNTGPLTFPTYTITVIVSEEPVISLSGTLNSFITIVGTPSDAQSYTLMGHNLTANISVTAPTGFEISSNGSSYSSNLSLSPTYNGSIYVRLTGTTLGTFSGNITHTSTGAAQVDLPVSGTVLQTLPPVLHITGTLNKFTMEQGTPSESQSYTLYGENLTQNISITPPSGYQLSQDNINWFSSLSLAPDFNGTIYVRLSGSNITCYNGNINHSSGEAEANLAVTGIVFEPTSVNLLLLDNFYYDEGLALTATRWTAHSGSGTNSVTVQSGNLTYENYPSIAGNYVSLANSGEDINRTFTAQTANSVYASFLVNVTSATTTGDYFIHFGPQNIGTTFRNKIFVKKNDADALSFGLSNAANAAGAVWTDFNYSLNTTYLLVLRYDIFEGAANDVAHLYINPPITINEPAYTLTATDTNTDTANIGSIALRQGSAANAPTLLLDGIRVANSWFNLWGLQANPQIIVIGEPEPMYNIEGNPSDEISHYHLEGQQLAGPITIIAPEPFQISTTGTDGWSTTLQVPLDYNGNIYVRLLGMEVGTYGGYITHNSYGAEEVRVRVDGETFPADVTWNITANLTEFTQEIGTPSAAQSYSLSATNAVTDIIVTATSPFELSTSNSGPWSSSLTLPSSFNSLIYVRMNADTAGDFTGTITHSTANATNYVINVSGTATVSGIFATDLFISEYIEGTSFNKAIEIFNGTGATIDLSQYKLCLYTNGSSTVSYSMSLSGTLEHNDVYVLAHPSADPAILAVADTTSSLVINFNGDDAVALITGETSNPTYIDIFGRIGERPSVGYWGTDPLVTKDKTLVRKLNITYGVTVNPESGFPTLATEWDSYPVDTFTYLDYHIFSPGQQPAAAPTFDPPAGIYSSPINVTISSITPGVTIRYTTDGSTPSETVGTIYTTPVYIDATTTLKAVAYSEDYALSPVSQAIYLFPVNVSTIAELRAGTPGTYYKYTGTGVLTFQQAFRHQKFIQDTTAGILIDDNNGVITTVYNLYDGISNIIGTVAEYGGMMQLTPIADSGPAVSTGNVIIPQEISLNELVSDFEAYESELVKVMNVSFDTADNVITFTNGTLYPMNNGLMNFRTTFYDVDYIGMPVPTGLWNIIGIPNSRVIEGNLFTARFWADFSSAGIVLPAPVVTILVEDNTIILSWEQILGATSYRIEAADDPYGTFTLVETTTNLNVSYPAFPRKFYRVIAIQ
jgi:hypothetical protein